MASKRENWRRAFPWILFALALASFGFYQWISWSQWASHRVYLADVGVMNSALSSYLHDVGFLRHPLAPTVEGNYFGIHFRPVFLLIMALYTLADHVMTLLSFYAFFAAAAVVPLGLLALRVTGSRILALSFALLYATNHFITSIHLAQHPEILVFAGWFTAFWALESQRPWWYAIGLLWVVSVKEDLGGYVFLLGAAQFLEKDPARRRWGIWSMAAGVAWTGFAFLMMRVSGMEAFHEANVNPGSRFDLLQAGPLAIAGRLFDPTLIALFASVGFLALIDWRTIWIGIIGAWFFMSTGDPIVGKLGYYYSYAAMPFFFYAAIRGSAWLLDRVPNRRQQASLILAALLFLTGAISFFLPTRTDNYTFRPFQVTDYHRQAREIARSLPDEASMAAAWDLYCQVPNRETLLGLRLANLDRVDYVFISRAGSIANLAGEEKKAEREAVFERLNSEEFTTQYDDGTYVVLARPGVTP